MADDRPIRVLLAEDQPIFRLGLVHVLGEAGLEVVATTADARDVVRKAQAHAPDVAVIDIQMPPNFGDDGLKAAQVLRAMDPPMPVMVLSQFLEDRYALELLGDRPQGVGYLLKERLTDPKVLVDGVRQVTVGGSVIDAEVVARLVGRRRERDPVDELSPREREVLILMAQGKSNHGIACELVVTVSAVERHVTSILFKLNIPRAGTEHRRVLAVLQYLHSRTPEPRLLPMIRQPP